MSSCSGLLASYAGSSQLFNVAQEKTRERGKTYHMSDVAGGIDLQVMQVEPSQVSSTRYVTRMITFTRLPCFSRATLKSWEEPGYEATIYSHFIPNLLI